MLRQNNIPFITDSISLITDAPVVVNPAIDSKYASVKVSNVPERRYGRDPNNDITIHARVTMTKASLCVISSLFFLFVSRNRLMPAKKVMMNDFRRDIKSDPS